MQFKVNDKSFDGACLLDKDGNPIDNVNSIPTSQRSSTLDNTIDERYFGVVSFSVGAGGAGNYSKAQIFNPVGSGKKIIVARCATWHASGSVTYQASITQTQFTDDIGTSTQKMCAGGSIEPTALIKKKNTDTTLSTVWTSKNSHSTTASNGGSVVDSQIVLKEGYGLNFECNTANTAFSGNLFWIEI